MGKTAFIFEGQANYYRGMGSDFYDNEDAARDVFDTARRATGLDLQALCFTDQKSLKDVEYSGIAVVTVETAIMRSLREAGIACSANCGLNMGMYSALISSGVIGMAEAFRLVRKHSIYMQEACPTGGAIGIISGLGEKILEKLIKSVDGRASIAEYDCPGQMVVTGDKAAVRQLLKAADEAGAEKTVLRNVSLPYCSELMKTAELRLGDALETVEFNFFRIPFVSTVTADFVYSPDDVAPLLTAQMCVPIRFQQSIEHLIFEGYTDFICIGPGRTTEKMIKKIYASVNTAAVENYEDFRRAVKIYSKR